MNFTNYNIENFGFVRLPSIELTKEEKSLCKNEVKNNLDFLKQITNQGFQARILEKPYIKKNIQVYKDRAKLELDIFEELNFVDYLLLCYRIYLFCWNNDIMTGPGRGSCSGSLIFFLLGMTQRDPIKDKLFFERFISKNRSKKRVVGNIILLDGSLICDVDIDIQQDKRHLVVEYLKSLYPDRVSRISTFNSLSSRLLIKECCKIIEEIPEQETVDIASKIPKQAGFVKDLEKTYEEDKPFQDWADKHKEIYNIALKLRDLKKNIGLHPSGYAVSYEKLGDTLPLHLTPDKEIAVSYDMEQIAKNCIKLDLLGLRTMTVIQNVCKQLNIKTSDINVDDDPIIYNNLQNLTTPAGLFQIEQDIALNVLNKIKPKNIYQLSDVMCLARPGAIQFLDQYLENDLSKVNPLFKDILKQTHGTCLYQESAMQMFQAVGFSPEDAETCRKIIGKKLVDKVKEWQKKIEDKCIEMKHDKSIGDLLWSILEASAKYSLNLSHSLAYSHLSAITIYLKFKYTSNFYLALLRQSINEPNPLQEISKIQKELKYFNITLKPPHLLKSDLDFKLENSDIRFGLSSIKGISEKTFQKLIDFRKVYGSKFELFKAAADCKIGIGVLSALIQAGAMDDESYNISRSRLVLEAQIWNILTEKEQLMFLEWAAPNEIEFNKQFNYDIIKIIKYFVNTNDEKGKSYIRGSRFETIKRNYQKAKEVYLVNSKSEKLANFFYERLLTGFTHSEKLYDLFKNSCADLISLQEANDSFVDDNVTTVGILEEVVEWTSKAKGTKCLKLIINDEQTSLKCMAFNDTVATIRENNGGFLPKEGDIIAVRGRKKEDCLFINNVFQQPQHVFMRHSDIKIFKKQRNIPENVEI